MSDLIWLMDEQIERLRSFFPKSRCKSRIDDRRVLIGIVFVNRNGLRWRNAASEYGSHKTLASEGHPALDAGLRSRNEPVRYDRRGYRCRNRIEIMFGSLKG